MFLIKLYAEHPARRQRSQCDSYLCRLESKGEDIETQKRKSVSNRKIKATGNGVCVCVYVHGNRSFSHSHDGQKDELCASVCLVGKIMVQYKPIKCGVYRENERIFVLCEACLIYTTAYALSAIYHIFAGRTQRSHWVWLNVSHGNYCAFYCHSWD